MKKGSRMAALFSFHSCWLSIHFSLGIDDFLTNVRWYYENH